MCIIKDKGSNALDNLKPKSIINIDKEACSQTNFDVIASTIYVTENTIRIYHLTAKICMNYRIYN